jgi:hypothetical protein
MASAQPDVSCDSELYKHQPLDLNKHQIRLLSLCNPAEHTMDYRLTTFDFDEKPPYVALSYTWGEECPTGFVNIDGKKLEIRMNLLNFLRTYATDEYLWIDQICIDQSNPDEQSHQVRMMCNTYSKCDYVLVWLRNETTCTPSTKQAALDFNDGVQSYYKHGHCEDGSSDDKTDFDCPTLALLHNPYFDRLWIVQEVLVPKDMRVLVEGNVWVSWWALQMKSQERKGQIRSLLPSTSEMLEAQFHRHFTGRYEHTLLTSNVTTLVGHLCDKECKDPRDKVYGLMALTRPEFPIRVDYTQSVHQVFLDAMRAMIKEYWCMTPIPHSDPDEPLRGA